LTQSIICSSHVLQAGQALLEALLSSARATCSIRTGARLLRWLLRHIWHVARGWHGSGRASLGLIRRRHSCAIWDDCAGRHVHSWVGLWKRHSTAWRHTWRWHLRWHASWRATSRRTLVLSHSIEIDHLWLRDILRHGAIWATDSLRRRNSLSQAVSVQALA